MFLLALPSISPDPVDRDVLAGDGDRAVLFIMIEALPVVSVIESAAVIEMVFVTSID